MSQVVKEKDSMIAELKRTLASEMSASSMAASVMTVDSSTAPDSQLTQDPLMEKEEIIKTLQEKV